VVCVVGGADDVGVVISVFVKSVVPPFGFELFLKLEINPPSNPEGLRGVSDFVPSDFDGSTFSVIEICIVFHYSTTKLKKYKEIK
jgi:hypothetical protein